MLVDTILRSKGMTVFTVSAGARVADAVAELNKHNVGAVIVTQPDGEVGGIISERDIVRLLGRDPVNALNRPVSECMTTNVITCTRDTSVATLMEQMTRYRIRHIPIVEHGKLLGIVSIGDVVNFIIRSQSHAIRQLTGYISGEYPA